MYKIKILGIFVFLISLSLIVISVYVSNQNTLETKVINTINRHKALTQDISKTIFYIHKNKLINNDKLESSINHFLLHHNNNINEISFHETKAQKDKIIKLWNKFYLMVDNFRKTNRVTSAYSKIILEKIINDIYNLNLTLIVEFDKLIDIHQTTFDNKLNIIRYLQYMLFFVLISLLIYLFTQLKVITSFIQKFLYTSEKIIKNSTIKDLEPINIQNNNAEILEASNNFNLLVKKIDTSIENATISIENTHNLLEQVEQNIEDMLEFFYQMQEDDKIDEEFTKKEDTVIESLEKLISTRTYLYNLKNNLDNLITHSKIK